MTTNNVYHLLPKLTLNKFLVRDLLEADSPCFALGLLEIRKEKRGLFLLRPSEIIPQAVTDEGFSLGHSLFGTQNNAVYHFSFKFYGHGSFSGFVDPGDKNVEKVISTILESKDFFVFVLNPDRSLTSFRGGEGLFLDNLRDNYIRFNGYPCSDDAYNQIVKKGMLEFEDEYLEWVCRDNKDYLDFSDDNKLNIHPS